MTPWDGAVLQTSKALKFINDGVPALSVALPPRGSGYNKPGRKRSRMTPRTNSLAKQNRLIGQRTMNNH